LRQLPSDLFVSILPNDEVGERLGDSLHHGMYGEVFCLTVCLLGGR
jgi:hypothetical protein